MEITRVSKRVIVREGQIFSFEKNPPGYWEIPMAIKMEKRRKTTIPANFAQEKVNMLWKERESETIKRRIR